MITGRLSQFETSLLAALNLFAEPLIRAGFGNPILWPSGAIVLETKGRNTGRTYKVPLLATRAGSLLVVSTVRGRSQWIKNVAASAQVRYWMGGRTREATAFVIAPGPEAQPLDHLPPLARCLASMLRVQSNLFKVSFAILVPHNSKTEVI